MVSTGALETVRKPRCELGGLKAYLSSGQQLKEKDTREEKKIVTPFYARLQEGLQF